MSNTRTTLTNAFLLNVYVPVIENVLSNLSTVVKFTEEGSSLIMHRLPQLLFSKFFLESIKMLCLSCFHLQQCLKFAKSQPPRQLFSSNARSPDSTYARYHNKFYTFLALSRSQSLSYLMKI